MIGHKSSYAAARCESRYQNRSHRKISHLLWLFFCF